MYILYLCRDIFSGNVRWVRLGDINLRSISEASDPQDFKVERVFRHPQYTPPSRYHDIALIQLNQTVRYTAYVKPACLHSDFELPSDLLATGWGKTDFANDKISDTLMKVDLSHVPIDKCNAPYGKVARQLPNGIVDALQLCAGGKWAEEKDTCAVRYFYYYFKI